VLCAELRKGGREMVVSLENLSSYVSLVSHWLLVEGVSTQMEAVREGFTSVFPIASLQMFYPGTLHQSPILPVPYVIYHTVYRFVLSKYDLPGFSQLELSPALCIPVQNWRPFTELI
jgi:hypothetical protein